MINPHDHEDEMPELAALPKAIAPDPAVEDAVVASLERRGVLRHASRRRAWLAAAAVLIAFVGGLLLGRQTAPSGAATAVSAPASEHAPVNVQAAPTSVPPGTTITWF